MAKWVIKRGGKKAPFSAAKIKKSIRDAAKDAHLPSVRIKKAVNKISRVALKLAAKRKVIATATLKKKILSQLAKVEPAAAKSWRKYDQRRRARRRKR